MSYTICHKMSTGPYISIWNDRRLLAKTVTHFLDIGVILAVTYWCVQLLAKSVHWLDSFLAKFIAYPLDIGMTSYR